MKLKFLLFTALLTGTTYSGIIPKSYDFRALYNHSKIDGFVQIPKGGQFGTTSLKRPTFNEMGINRINFPEFQAQANWENFSVYGDIKYSTFKGNATLKDNLISHNKILPKNSYFKTTHKYINYTLGLKYNLYSQKHLEIKPLVEMSFCDFSYKYDATTPNQTKISSKRNFGWGQANVGLEIINPITDKYSIETTFKYALKHKKVRKYYNLNIINKYNIYTNDTLNSKLNILFGIGYGKSKFKDRQQDRQNHIVQTIKPNFIFGLEYTI